MLSRDHLATKWPLSGIYRLIVRMGPKCGPRHPDQRQRLSGPCNNQPGNWIVQELVVANQPMLVCGLRIASLEHLYALFLAWAGLHLQPNVPFRLFDDTNIDGSAYWVSAILLTRAGYREGGEQQPDLLELLNRCRYNIATNPRDKIYSL